MRLHRFLVICVLLAVVGRTLADNLSVEDVTLQPGENVQVGIVLNNPDKTYAAFQFDLVLPEGVSVAKNDKGKFIASLNADRADDHSLNVSLKGERTYRFLSFSMTNSAFSGTTGVLVYVTLTADNSLAQTAQAAITSQVLTEPDGTQNKCSDTSFSISQTLAQKCATPVITYNKGRLNFSCATLGAKCVSSIVADDGQTNTDGNGIDLTARYVITVYATAEGYADSAPATASIVWGDGTMAVENITVEGTRDMPGDVDGSGTVDVSDYIGVANIILTGSINGQ